MAKSPVNYRVVFNRMPELTEEMKRQVSVVIRTATFQTQAYARVDAPVDTSNLRNSIFAEIVTPLHGRVTVGAEYGIYVNFGTYKMAAQPFFTRAVERVVDQVPSQIQAALGGVR